MCVLHFSTQFLLLLSLAGSDFAHMCPQLTAFFTKCLQMMMIVILKMNLCITVSSDLDTIPRRVQERTVIIDFAMTDTAFALLIPLFSRPPLLSFSCLSLSLTFSGAFSRTSQPFHGDLGSRHF